MLTYSQWRVRYGAKIKEQLQPVLESLFHNIDVEFEVDQLLLTEYKHYQITYGK